MNDSLLVKDCKVINYKYNKHEQTGAYNIMNFNAAKKLPLNLNREHNVSPLVFLKFST